MYLPQTAANLILLRGRVDSVAVHYFHFQVS